MNLPVSSARPPGSAGRRAILSWCFYDWANSAFPTVVSTFLFPAYFAKLVAQDEIAGTAAWGFATSIAAIAIAILSPPLGAIADQGGPRKPWLAALTLITGLSTATLWFVMPTKDDVGLALWAMALGTVGFELGIVFYNAMLPELAPPGWLGRLSGWAWGLGYAGGLLCLLLSLTIFVQPIDPPFGLDKENAQHIRATMILSGLWIGLFSLPLFFFVPDRPRSALGAGQAIVAGFRALLQTLRALKHHANIARFLLAKMIYIDGLNTLFAFGGIYAVGVIGMSFDEVLIFGIVLNVAAGSGAVLFGWLDDRLGAKPTIQISLVALILLSLAILPVANVAIFYALAILIGLFLGPTQAASRSLMARLAPPELRTEFFGLYALAGKATAFLGPALLAWATTLFVSQRAGMATIPIFFVVGLLLLRGVKEKVAGTGAETSDRAG